jgi:hypothetical protein
MDDLRKFLREPWPVFRKIIRAAGTIYLVFTPAAIASIAFSGGPGLTTALGFLALIAVPIWGGALVVLMFFGVVYLACLPFRVLLRPAAPHAKSPQRANDVWDWDFDV